MITFIESFGHEFIHEEILKYTFRSKGGLEISITNFGGIITSIKIPDRNGDLGEITMGFDSLKPYIENHPYFGCIVGRYANRIGKSTFFIDGNQYHLTPNAGGNHLHGGAKGFDKKMWNPILEDDNNSASLKLFYLSKDMEEGYPGNLLANIIYKIFDNNSFEIHYHATTDKATHINLTSHCYFNLNGFKKDVLEHELMIDADNYLEIDDEMIPTGELAVVQDTPFDFRKTKRIGLEINNAVNGYDNCFVLNSPSLAKPCAIAVDSVSGRFMKVFTTQPGLQLYTSNFLDGKLVGHNNTRYSKHGAFCLETQHYPDSPNKPNFPTTLLKPNQEYYHVSRFEFGLKD